MKVTDDGMMIRSNDMQCPNALCQSNEGPLYQSGASTKCTIQNVRDRWRYDDTEQRAALIECPLSNRTKAIMKLNLYQSGASTKCIQGNMLYRMMDTNPSHILGTLTPLV